MFVLVNFESQLDVDLPPASSLPKADCITCQLYNLHRNGQCIRHGRSGILVDFYPFPSVVSAFPIESGIRCMILFTRPHFVSCLLLRPCDNVLFRMCLRNNLIYTRSCTYYSCLESWIAIRFRHVNRRSSCWGACCVEINRTSSRLIDWTIGREKMVFFWFSCHKIRYMYEIYEEKHAHTHTHTYEVVFGPAPVAMLPDNV